MKLTTEQAERIIETARETGRERAAEQGDEFRESDYLAGVMTAFWALESQEQVPQWWYIGTMSGRPVLLDDETHARHVQAQAERRQAVAQLKELRSARLLLESVAGLGTRCARFLGMEED